MPWTTVPWTGPWTGFLPEVAFNDWTQWTAAGGVPCGCCCKCNYADGEGFWDQYDLIHGVTTTHTPTFVAGNPLNTGSVDSLFHSGVLSPPSPIPGPASRYYEITDYLAFLGANVPLRKRHYYQHVLGVDLCTDYDRWPSLGLTPQFPTGCAMPHLQICRWNHIAMFDSFGGASFNKEYNDEDAGGDPLIARYRTFVEISFELWTQNNANWLNTSLPQATNWSDYLARLVISIRSYYVHDNGGTTVPEQNDWESVVIYTGSLPPSTVLGVDTYGNIDPQSPGTLTKVRQVTTLRELSYDPWPSTMTINGLSDYVQCGQNRDGTTIEQNAVFSSAFDGGFE